ncbi:hypothetical protein Pres01_29920 [Metapseudomonas resinovorans]|nr:hypothetical protein Pres01_29920 [Pseudomonas resinovorans]
MLQLSIAQIVGGYATPKRETSPKRWSDNQLPHGVAQANPYNGPRSEWVGARDGTVPADFSPSTDS